MSLQSIVFSTFLTNELTTAKNIKDRVNRHNVIRILTIINERLKIEKNETGLFIYSGIDEYKDEILQIIRPLHKVDIFYYNCSNQFNIEIVKDYLQNYSGLIIFANGEECFIYKYDNQFIKIKHIDANLDKRQKKGGQSALRISRLAEESRERYITKIIDHLNSTRDIHIKENTDNYIFGSNEILNMIFYRKKDIYIKLSNGGFYNFNNTSINNTKHWLHYLKPNENNDSVYEKIILFLETNVDILDFSIENKNEMNYYVLKEDDHIDNDKKIVLNKNSKYYSKLCVFEYIGVKYFSNSFLLDE